MTREERTKLLRQIEKDICVCSIESTFLDDAKSCAIHSAIEELEREPCEDCVSRQAVIDIVNNPLNIRLDEIIKKLPPVTPQPKTGYCKECKYFEHDSAAKVDGIPLIVAHEICSRWGNGCKTKEDGYCFLFEPQEENEAQEALDTALNALDEVEKYKQIIDDIKDIFIDSLIFGELWDFKHDKISDDDVINEMNRVFKNEVEQAINKHLKGVKL